jgi:hypothetical protein
MTRLQTIFVPGDSGTTDLFNRGEFPVLIFAEPDASDAIRQRIGTWNDAQIFLVDPLGNLFMSYPPGTEMGDVRKDLGHLLKLSGIG